MAAASVVTRISARLARLCSMADRLLRIETTPRSAMVPTSTTTNGMVSLAVRWRRMAPMRWRFMPYPPPWPGYFLATFQSVMRVGWPSRRMV